MKQDQRPKIDLGYRLGRLTVALDTGKRKNGYVVWQCVCDCGGTLELDTRALQRATRRDCGCVTRVRPGQRDLTGQRFGRLTALEPTDRRDGSGTLIWLCRCDCGNEVMVSGTQLTGGYKKSCGCLSHPPLKDYLGRRFGRLTVTAYAGKRAGMHRWECLCDCGSTTVVGQTLLRTGKTRSCGCLQAQAIRRNMRYVDGTSVTLLERAGRRLSRANTSGYNGVYLNKKTGKWVALIGFKGKRYYLGSYEEVQAAAEARRQAEQQLYGEFLDWYYQAYGKETTRAE